MVYYKLRRVLQSATVQMVNATFAYHKTGGVNNYAYVVFNIFVPNLLIRLHKFATFLPEGYLSASRVPKNSGS